MAKGNSIYLSDHWTTDDGLNFDVFKPALMDILQNCDTPLTVGVFGTWGSGKTSLLRMLEKDIHEMGLAKFRTVWFTAWKYDKQDALWRAFILRVIDGLYPKEKGRRLTVDEITDENQKEGIKYLDRLAESVYQTVGWQGEESWSLDVAKTTKEAVKLPLWLALHLAKLGDAAKELGISPKMADLIGREAKNYSMQQLSSMEQFDNSFQDAIKKLLGDEGRLVVFVDDLDRCLPEKSVQILEAIKLFLNVPQTVFVLGMDREIVRRGIESHYKIFTSAKDGESRPDLPINGDVYLQKLIQIPFNLPPLDAVGRGKFIETLEEIMASGTRLNAVTREVFARGLFPNPRQVKRALNVFNLLRTIAAEQEKQELIPKDSIAEPLLAKTVLIQSQWPELYTQWRQYPTLVQTLEAEYRKQPLTERELIIGKVEETLEEQLEEDVPGEIRKQVSSSKPQIGGLLARYINDRSKYVLLWELLTFPDIAGEDDQKARFEGLSREQLTVYLGLAGTAEHEVSQEDEEAIFTDLLSLLVSGDPAIINEGLARIQEEEPDPEGPIHQEARRTVLRFVQTPDRPPMERAAMADALDELGYLPPDLYTFVPIPDSESPKFYTGKYPVTNIQYQRFIEAKDFADKQYWEDFPKFSEPDEETSEIQQIGNWGAYGWDWLQDALKDKDISPDGKAILPRYWNDPRFGNARAGVPVVGITWHEANAYCKWLLAHWNEQPEAGQNPGWRPELVRLPTETDWIASAGGNKPENRFPWDRDGEITEEEAEILKWANVGGSGIGRTTPVGMYPLGASPRGVWDLGGNVWEWQANYYERIIADEETLALRGGSWDYAPSGARLSSRIDLHPGDQWYGIGFRVAAFPSGRS